MVYYHITRSTKLTWPQVRTYTVHNIMERGRKTINFIFNSNMSLLLLHRPPTMYDKITAFHLLVDRYKGKSLPGQQVVVVPQIDKHFTTLMTIYEECDFNLLTSGLRAWTLIELNVFHGTTPSSRRLPQQLHLYVYLCG